MLVNSQSWTIEGTERKMIYQGISMGHGGEENMKKKKQGKCMCAL